MNADVRKMDEAANHPTAEAYHVFMEAEWRDVHHSRLQEWSALGVVVGAHFAIFQVVKVVREIAPEIGVQLYVLVGAIVAGLFAAFGGLITMRHRHLMRVKLYLIFQAEDRLGLIKDDQNTLGIFPREIAPKEPGSWDGLSWPRPLSTSGLILSFYLLLLLLDLTAVVLVIG